jgi:hypothetical protein
VTHMRRFQILQNKCLKLILNVPRLYGIIKQRLLSIILCATLIIILSVILYGQVLLKKKAMYGVKKSSFCSGADQRNKYICFLFINFVKPQLVSHITKNLYLFSW